MNDKLTVDLTVEELRIVTRCLEHAVLPTTDNPCNRYMQTGNGHVEKAERQRLADRFVRLLAEQEG